MLLRKYISHEQTENGYVIHGDAADILLVFMTDDIIRVRVSFSRKFPEASYALIHTAWPDRLDSLFAGERERVKALDVPCEESADALTFRTKSMTLKMKKAPLSFTLYDASGKCIYRDLPERAFERDQLGRLSHYSCMDREHDHFYGFGEKTGHLDKKGRRLRMSPKDAIDTTPKTETRCTSTYPSTFA